MPKKILIINTGGTLSSVKSSKGLVPGMRSDDMLEELRMVSRNLELETEDFCSLDSANIGPKDWSGLAEMIARKSYDYQGIVVIHGTDTIYIIYAGIYATEYSNSCSYHRKSVIHCKPGCRRTGKLPLWHTYGCQWIPGSICCVQQKSDSGMQSIQSTNHEF